MLPPTCAIKNPNNLDVSILSSNNYWLQSMWLKCVIHNTSKQVELIPIDFVYCGGNSKERQGNDRFFELDAQKRLVDIISLSQNAERLPNDLSQCIDFFSNIYLGKTSFDYNTCIKTTNKIMVLLAKNYPDKYAGIEDPLPFLMSLTNSTNQDKQYKPSVVTDSIPDTFRPYITAIRTKPFLLLAGISGTGKSRIVRELARACSGDYDSQKPQNFEMIQVKPNWHDSSDILGYVSRVSGTPVFVAGDFLKFVVKAWEYPEMPYFLCLDEMNLAPVEQYFAEFLSVFESRKLNDEHEITTDPILKPEFEKINAEDGTPILKPWYSNLIGELLSGCPADKHFALKMQFETVGISLPQNLIVVGTVNMDETTFSFSRKVLDRAMTIEMNTVDLRSGLDNKHESIGKISKNEIIADSVEGVDIYQNNKEVCDQVLDFLQKVNDVLEGSPFKIAYRTRNEFLIYVVNNLPYKKDKDGVELSDNQNIERSLDEVTCMKILPRIEGDEEKTSRVLDELEKVLKEQLAVFLGDGFDENKSISLKKIKEMKNRLKSGYTSFWS
ncbi:MAG: AAA family ATPase [Bacteroidales bacterium]|nr:AAA family ATPase [Bacteroidales bacterium]